MEQADPFFQIIHSFNILLIYGNVFQSSDGYIFSICKLFFQDPISLTQVICISIDITQGYLISVGNNYMDV
jgi:hypothetical protein